MQSPICIHSEVGKLKKVLVHRPGMELENLIPEYLSHLLFDDIPYLNVAREEHDFFTQTLRECGAEVIYLKDLLTEAVEAAGAKEQLVEDYIREAHVYGLNARQALREYLTSLSVPDLFDAMSMGMRKSQLHLKQRVHLADFTHEDFPFYAEPMPNLYFTRDPFSCIDSGVLLSRMANEIRQRETLLQTISSGTIPFIKTCLIGMSVPGNGLSRAETVWCLTGIPWLSACLNAPAHRLLKRLPSIC